MFKNKIILVIGGAGSIGSTLAKRLLLYKPKVVRVFDIDEYNLFKLKRETNNEKLRFFLGDIRDRWRIKFAFKDVDIAFHLAAIKNIEISEYNPIETIETNIEGTINTIIASLKAKPKKFLYISSDKAVDFSTLYGATKFIGEKLTLWAQKIQEDTIYSVIRLGNVFETRGNVFEIWKEEIEKGKKPSITDVRMKRYFITLHEAVDAIIKACQIAKGGEIFIPKMKEYRIVDLLPKKEYKIIGRRWGEKLREKLMTEEERKKAKLEGNLWIIKNT